MYNGKKKELLILKTVVCYVPSNLLLDFKHNRVVFRQKWYSLSLRVIVIFWMP